MQRDLLAQERIQVSKTDLDTHATPSILVESPAPVLRVAEPSDLSALKQQARHSLAALFIRYGMALIIGLAGTVLLSRLVGPAVWGAFAIAQVVYLSSQEILGRGIATHLIRQQNIPSRAEIGNTFVLQHLVGIIFLIGAGLLAGPMARWYSHPELSLLLLAAALAAYLYAWRSLPVALLERELDYVRVALVEILDATSFCVVAIGFVWMGHPILGLSVALIARSFVSAIGAYLLKPFSPRLWLFHDSNFSRVMDFGSFVAASSLLNIVIVSIPPLLGGWIIGVANVGQVQMAISLYSSLLFASAAILRLSFSAYSRLLKYPGELQRVINGNLETAALALVPAVTLFAGLSPIWAPLLFGAKWPLLPVLVLAHAPAYLLAAVFWGIISSALVVSGKHRQVCLFLACFVMVYAALTILATAKLGAVGVPIAASATHVLLYPFLFSLYQRSLGKLRYGKLAAEIVIGAVFAAGMWLCAQSQMWMAVPVAGLYVAIWYLRHSHFLNTFARSVRGSLLRPSTAGEKV